MNNGPMIKLTGMFENVSAKGSTYFVGYLGGTKLVMLRDMKAEEGQPQWSLFLAERPEKRDAPGSTAARTAPKRVATGAQRSARQVPASGAPERRFHDDEIPFLG